MTGVHDPYGLEYGDWVDPYTHSLIEMCTGCPMCVTWEGKPYDQIRAERMALVSRRRLRERSEPTTIQVARDDRAYWDQKYSA